MNVNAPPKKRMKVPEFLDWAEKQEGHYELAGGEIVVMSPERIRHNLVKGAVYLALGDAIGTAGLTCMVFGDGVGLVIDADTIRVPDASVQSGTDINLDSMTIDAPLIVVEVTAPSSDRRDTEVKLVEYFSVPSIRHYLIVIPEKGAVVHHRKSETGEISTRIARDGEIELTPPGLSVAVAALLGPPSAARGAEEGR